MAAKSRLKTPSDLATWRLLVTFMTFWEASWAEYYRSLVVMGGRSKRVETGEVDSPRTVFLKSWPQRCGREGKETGEGKPD